MLSIFKKLFSKKEVEKQYVVPPELDEYILGGDSENVEDYIGIDVVKLCGFIRPTPDLTPGDIKIGVPDEAAYEITKLRWHEPYNCCHIPDERKFYALNPEDEKPHLYILLKAKQGHIFGQDVELEINGENVQKVKPEGDGCSRTTYFPEGWRWGWYCDIKYSKEYSRNYRVIEENYLAVFWTEKHACTIYY